MEVCNNFCNNFMLLSYTLSCMDIDFPPSNCADLPAFSGVTELLDWLMLNVKKKKKNNKPPRFPAFELHLQLVLNFKRYWFMPHTRKYLYCDRNMSMPIICHLIFAGRDHCLELEGVREGRLHFARYISSLLCVFIITFSL